MLGKIAAIVASSVAVVIGGTILLRLSGRKSVLELTLASTVVMIMLGEILSGPLEFRSIWETLLAVGACLAALISIELLQFKLNWLRRLVSGRPLALIDEGRIVEDALRKLRMSKEDLAIRLREQKVERVDDVKRATMETNGKVTIELQPHAKPVTVGDLEKLLASWGLAPQRDGSYGPGEEEPVKR
ncbi:DUF421 domain-containing protein [Gordoniibacillus kamchatkensis]|uniref:DUF421 domain-containing protein n=1 Tax=Gordoniibacillus kamchatkensis TaxID=1590651 RepID=UPI000695E43B|nr:YetF domain-containing protein [Paenibacillus sp. VKM B-2647]